MRPRGFASLLRVDGRPEGETVRATMQQDEPFPLRTKPTTIRTTPVTRTRDLPLFLLCRNAFGAFQTSGRDPCVTPINIGMGDEGQRPEACTIAMTLQCRVPWKACPPPVASHSVRSVSERHTTKRGIIPESLASIRPKCSISCHSIGVASISLFDDLVIPTVSYTTVGSERFVPEKIDRQHLLVGVREPDTQIFWIRSWNDAYHVAGISEEQGGILC
jgi:hypothetical protein